MRKRKHKLIGIIGGQGPASTTDLYMRIISFCQKNFGEKRIKDYPPVIIYSVPTPDLIRKVKDEKVTFKLIKQAVKYLEGDGCDLIIIACNSLQYFLNGLQKSVKVPVIGIVPIVAEYVKKKGYMNVGILATSTTIKKKIYAEPLNKIGVNVLKPDVKGQKKVEDAIYGVIGGINTKKYTKIIKHVIADLQKNGAEAVLLACTEISMIINQLDTKMPLIDCSELYARHIAMI